MGRRAVTAHSLAEIAHKLVGSGKGLLAMDESNGTCDKRFVALGIAPGERMRRAYRELIVTTPGLGDSISGAILYDETIRQETRGGTPFVRSLIGAGIIPGIKVDTGAKDLAGWPGEKVTEGLDGLRTRLLDYFRIGARFAKWRAVISPAEGGPSSACLDANAHALARYAALCQEAGLVPIVEPEVLMDGAHPLSRCVAVTEATLRAVFAQLNAQGVLLEGMILKPNMLLPGLSFPAQDSIAEVAAATVQSLRRVVPAAVPGVAFLSGGQSPELASARLNAINVLARSGPARLPWPLVFSFARAIQQPALAIWRGQEANVEEAQRMLAYRAHCNRAALSAEYDPAEKGRPA
jgi:fructose-bisphosphate aldolase class I